MVKEILTKVKFAKMAGVSPAAITKACAGSLAGALEGKRINASHPDAVAYIAARHEACERSNEKIDGIDPLYEEALAACRAAGNFTPNFLVRTLKVSTTRAKRIRGMMDVSGLVPKRGEAVKVEKKVADIPARVATKKNPPPPREVSPSPDEEFDDSDMPEDMNEVADMTLRQLVNKFGTETRFKDWLSALKTIEDIREKRNKNASIEGTLIPRDIVELHVIGKFEQAHMNMLTDGAKTLSVRLHSMYAAGEDVKMGEKFITQTISRYINMAKTSIKRTMSHV